MKRRIPKAIFGPTFFICRLFRLVAEENRRLSSLFLAVTLLLWCGANPVFAASQATTDARATQSTQATVPAPGVTSDALKQFVHDYWQQRFTRHAQRVNWHDYQWQIEVVIPEAVSKLPPCRKPFQAEDAQTNLPVGRQTLRVRCSDSPGWMITTRSQISVLMPVVVARATLASEHYLQASDLAVTQVLLSAQLDDVIIDPAQAIGRRPMRSLRAGQPVRNKMLEATLMVRKGDKVRLTLAEAEMSISMEGTAMQDGQKGETIGIKNEKSGKIISALVSGPGQLLIVNEAPTIEHQN